MTTLTRGGGPSASARSACPCWTTPSSSRRRSRGGAVQVDMHLTHSLKATRFQPLNHKEWCGTTKYKSFLLFSTETVKIWFQSLLSKRILYRYSAASVVLHRQRQRQAREVLVAVQELPAQELPFPGPQRRHLPAARCHRRAGRGLAGTFPSFHFSPSWLVLFIIISHRLYTDTHTFHILLQSKHGSI